MQSFAYCSMSSSITNGNYSIMASYSPITLYAPTIINRLIRLHSPNLNYLIIFGSVLVYISCIVFVMPTFIPSAVAALCIVC